MTICPLIGAPSARRGDGARSRFVPCGDCLLLPEVSVARCHRVVEDTHPMASASGMLGSAMADALAALAVPIAIGASAVVLLLGLANLVRGGWPDRSQKLMRLRVLLQFVAIVVIMATMWGSAW